MRCRDFFRDQQHHIFHVYKWQRYQHQSCRKRSNKFHRFLDNRDWLLDPTRRDELSLHPTTWVKILLRHSVQLKVKQNIFTMNTT